MGGEILGAREDHHLQSHSCKHCQILEIVIHYVCNGEGSFQSQQHLYFILRLLIAEFILGWSVSYSWDGIHGAKVEQPIHKFVLEIQAQLKTKSKTSNGDSQTIMSTMSRWKQKMDKGLSILSTKIELAKECQRQSVQVYYLLPLPRRHNLP